MRPTRALLAFLIFVFAGGALISPWIYHALVGFGWSNIPFRRVVDRCLLVLALIGLWPFVSALGVRSRAELGLRKSPTLAKDLVTGLAIGSVLVVLAAAVSLTVGASHWIPRTGWMKQITSALTTAVVVATLEEILFRGAIMTALTRVSGALAGIVVSSSLYGILHFFGRPENPATVDWKAGFVVLGRMFSGFTDFQQVIPGFFSLTLLGVILALAFRRTAALYLSMGIHAGLIFWVKLFGFATDTTANANTWFWGTEKLVDGWFCFILLAITTIAFARMKPRAL